MALPGEVARRQVYHVEVILAHGLSTDFLLASIVVVIQADMSFHVPR